MASRHHCLLQKGGQAKQSNANLHQASGQRFSWEVCGGAGYKTPAVESNRATSKRKNEAHAK